jgi:hypothetical protein
VPWEATSLEGELSFFVPPVAPVAAAPARIPTAVATPAPAATPTLTPAPTQQRPAAPPVGTAATPSMATAPVSSPPSVEARSQDERDRERRTQELLAGLSTQNRPSDQPARATKTPRTATGYTVGDRWNYQVVDKQRGEVVRNYTVRVDKLLPGGRWSTGINVIYDEHGRLVETSPANGDTRRYSPHALRWWPGMAVGDRREFEIELERLPQGGTPSLQKSSSDARVVAEETVRVPAGEFKVLRIEHKGSSRNVGSYGAGTFTHTIWYSPELRNAVAQEVRSHWNGQQDTNIREELTSYTVAQPAR